LEVVVVVVVVVSDSKRHRRIDFLDGLTDSKVNERDA
jgi:hypothetical protein